jgi:hypothetical protein
MSCLSCASGNHVEFAAEINIHFPGLKNLDKPGVFVFPKVLVCLNCGFSRFTTPAPELALLQEVPRQAKPRPGNGGFNMSHSVYGTTSSSAE